MEQKHYRTVGRTVLLDFLAEATAKHPLSAGEICKALAGVAGAPAPSSVYRMLGELEREGYVRKFRSGEGDCAKFQYVGRKSECSHHFHLQCTACGRVEHLHCDKSEGWLTHILSSHGFAVDSGRSVLYGLCADCAPAPLYQRKEKDHA